VGRGGPRGASAGVLAQREREVVFTAFIALLLASGCVTGGSFYGSGLHCIRTLLDGCTVHSFIASARHGPFLLLSITLYIWKTTPFAPYLCCLLT
jgi:hypothetical protein